MSRSAIALYHFARYTWDGSAVLRSFSPDSPALFNLFKYAVDTHRLALLNDILACQPEMFHFQDASTQSTPYEYLLHKDLPSASNFKRTALTTLRQQRKRIFSQLRELPDASDELDRESMPVQLEQKTLNSSLLLSMHFHANSYRQRLAESIKTLFNRKYFNAYETCNVYSILLDIHDILNTTDDQHTLEGYLTRYLQRRFYGEIDKITHSIAATNLVTLICSFIDGIDPQQWLSLVYHSQLESVPRRSPWLNMTTLEEALPENPAELFISDSGHVHQIEMILDQAVPRIYQQHSDLENGPEYAFLGTDMANHGPLSATDCENLAQRSPAFRALHHEARRISVEIDASRDPTHRMTAYQRFARLRRGLLNGDARHRGEELNAGADAMVAIAEFANWWNQLPSDQRTHISALANGRLGQLLNERIIDPGNARSRGRVLYCVQLSGAELERLINQRSVRDTLMSMDSPFTPPPQEELIALSAAAKSQLLSYQSQIITMQTLTNARASAQRLQRQQPYTLEAQREVLAICRHSNKTGSLAALRRHIQCIKSIGSLNDLHQTLQHDDFSHLRRSSFISRYRAIIHGHSQITSRTFANIERLVALQALRIKQSEPQLRYGNHNPNQAIATFISHHPFLNHRRKVQCLSEGESFLPIADVINPRQQASMIAEAYAQSI